VVAWTSSRIAEFLEQKGAAQSALIDSLFQVHADA
jgi:hypothetical protein